MAHLIHMKRIAHIDYDEIEHYVLKLTPHQEDIFSNRYMSRTGGNYSPYTICNHLVGLYNKAVDEGVASIDLEHLHLYDKAYRRLCDMMIPFFEELRDVVFIPSKSKRNWKVFLADQDKYNQKDWEKACMSAPVGQPLLRIK